MIFRIINYKEVKLFVKICNLWKYLIFIYICVVNFNRVRYFFKDLIIINNVYNYIVFFFIVCLGLVKILFFDFIICNNLLLVKVCV